MMNQEKFVKLSAIERIAKSMDDVHSEDDKSKKKEEPKGHEVECPKCGHEFEYDAEDDSKEEDEDKD